MTATDVRLTISEEVRAYVYAQLAETAYLSIAGGDDPDSFVLFAIQVDAGSRWHGLAKRIFKPEELAKAAQEGPPVFMYGNLDSDTFLDTFGGLHEELEHELRAHRDKGEIRAIIIVHDGFWCIDIEPVPLLN